MPLDFSPASHDSLRVSGRLDVHADDQILRGLNESYVQSLMKLMSSKVLKELKAESAQLQRHLTAVTQDVQHLAGQLTSLRGEAEVQRNMRGHLEADLPTMVRQSLKDSGLQQYLVDAQELGAQLRMERSLHHESMAKLEVMREELQMGAAREKDFVAEMGQLKRWVEGRSEDILANHRHLDKDLRASLREFRSEMDEQSECFKSLQDVRGVVRELRGEVEEQREALKVVQDANFEKPANEARALVARLEEERNWHREAVKELREMHEDRQQRWQSSSADLERRTASFSKMLESIHASEELEKRDNALMHQVDQRMAQLQMTRAKDNDDTAERMDRFKLWVEGRFQELFDRAKIFDQDLVDKISYELVLLKDQQRRSDENLATLHAMAPSIARGETEVQQDCAIFRQDIRKLSEEILRHQESLQRLLPWTDWLQSAQPSVERWQRSRAEERLAALESLKAAELVQELESAMRRQDVRMEGQRKSVQDLESSLTILREDLQGARRRCEEKQGVLQKCAQQCQELHTFCSQDLEAMKSRLSHCEETRFHQQKQLKDFEEICSRCRWHCEQMARCQAPQAPQGHPEQRYLKDCEDIYAKWREDAVAWQQQQLQRLK